MATARRKTTCIKSSSISSFIWQKCKRIQIKIAVPNAREKVTEYLDFVQNGNFIRGISNENIMNKCSKRLVPCSLSEILTER